MCLFICFGFTEARWGIQIGLYSASLEFIVQHRLALNPCLSLLSARVYCDYWYLSLHLLSASFKTNCIKILFFKYLIIMLVNLVFVL